MDKNSEEELSNILNTVGLAYGCNILNSGKIKNKITDEYLYTLNNKENSKIVGDVFSINSYILLIANNKKTYNKLKSIKPKINNDLSKKVLILRE